MKTILHHDYWVEIPAGEFLTGLSETQREFIGNYIRNQVGYDKYLVAQRDLVESAVVKLRLYAKRSQGKSTQVSGLSDEEMAVWRGPLGSIIDVEHQLTNIPNQEPVWLDRFYIARFPLTDYQYKLFQDGTSARNLPGTLEEPIQQILDLPDDSPQKQLLKSVTGRGRVKVPTRLVATVTGPEKQLQHELGARLPSIFEWEKASRGTEGWLYPWGNEWNSEAGYFYDGQDASRGKEVNAFPQGISPYGVWAMAGGLPEFVTSLTFTSYTTKRGCHFKESSAAMAWFDHILVQPGKGGWVSLRLVLDEWPVQQWQGFRAEQEKVKDQTSNETKNLLNQFEWLVLKMQAGPELGQAITAIEAGQKTKSQNLLTKTLQKDPRNEHAWLLLTITLDDLDKQRECIQNALSINPTSEIGQKMKDKLAPPINGETV